MTEATCPHVFPCQPQIFRITQVPSHLHPSSLYLAVLFPSLPRPSIPSPNNVPVCIFSAVPHQAGSVPHFASEEPESYALPSSMLRVLTLLLLTLRIRCHSVPREALKVSSLFSRSLSFSFLKLLICKMHCFSCQGLRLSIGMTVSVLLPILYPALI